MGSEVVIEWRSRKADATGVAPCPLEPLVDRLKRDGLPCTVVMVDGALHAPAALVPADWRDVRLKTAVGTVTLSRKAEAVAIVVFSNADDALKAAQSKIADALRALAG